MKDSTALLNDLACLIFIVTEISIRKAVEAYKILTEWYELKSESSMRSLDVFLVLWIFVSGEKRAQMICAHWLSVVLRRAPPRIGHRQQL